MNTMNKLMAVLFCLIITPFIIIGCASEKSVIEKSNGSSMPDKKSEKTGSAEELYKYDELQKIQKILLKDFTWPQKHESDLNDDGIDEIFLAVGGYSRGMDYALFHKKNLTWELISGNETIPSGHLGIIKLKNKKNGWHDFTALQPSGRDGIIKSYFTWNGQKYVLKKQNEVMAGNQDTDNQ